MIFKVCGMREGNNIAELQAVQPDWMGLIFYKPSPRNVSFMPDALDKVRAKKIGVFVNESAPAIWNRIRTYRLDGVQLHGEEPPELCREFSEEKILVIKSFSVGRAFDLDTVAIYEGSCNYYLFDTKGIHPGGNGEPFDWGLLDQYKYDTPFLLSGGIGMSSLELLRGWSHPMWAGVDVNSRFEIKPGLKNIALIKKFKDELFSK